MIRQRKARLVERFLPEKEFGWTVPLHQGPRVAPVLPADVDREHVMS